MSAPVLVLGRVIGFEKVLAVETPGCESGPRKAKDQLFGMGAGKLAHLGEGGLEHARLVIRDIVARHADRAFEFPVLDREAMRGRVLDMARADPLAEPGKLAKPAIGLARAFAGHRHGDLVPVDFGGHVGVGADRLEPVIDQVEICGVDDHDRLTVSGAAWRVSGDFRIKDRNAGCLRTWRRISGHLVAGQAVVRAWVWRRGGEPSLKAPARGK